MCERERESERRGQRGWQNRAGEGVRSQATAKRQNIIDVTMVAFIGGRRRHSLSAGSSAELIILFTPNRTGLTCPTPTLPVHPY